MTRVLIVLCTLLLGRVLSAHESPIDHVDRRLKLRVDGTKLLLTYDLRQTQRAALLQLRVMDRDDDGRISNEERDQFLKQLAERQSRLLKIELNGKSLALKPVGRVALLPDLTQRFVFECEVRQLATGIHRGRLRDLHSRAYPGSFRVLQDRSKRKTTVRSLVDESVEQYRGHPGMLMLLFEVQVRE